MSDLIDLINEIAQEQMLGFKPVEDVDFMIVHSPSKTPKVAIVTDNNVFADQCYIVPRGETYKITKTEAQYKSYIDKLEKMVKEKSDIISSIILAIDPNYYDEPEPEDY